MTAKPNVNALTRRRTRKTPLALLFRLRRWILLAMVLMWALAITASHIPPEYLPQLPTSGKIFHILGFFALAGMFWLLLAAHGVSGARRDILVLLVMSAYAAFDEATQPYFHRNGRVSDWLLDAFSAALAVGFLRALAVPFALIVERVRLWRDTQRKIRRYLDANPVPQTHWTP